MIKKEKIIAGMIRKGDMIITQCDNKQIRRSKDQMKERRDESSLIHLVFNYPTFGLKMKHKQSPRWTAICILLTIETILDVFI